MWLDELKPGDSWMGVWHSKFTCGNCGGIIQDHVCPLCGFEHKPVIFTNELIKKGFPSVPTITLMGAIAYNTHVILGLMKREWERPLTAGKEVAGYNNQEVPERLIIVLLFWTLFESLMDQLVSKKLESIPPKIAKDLLKRYSTINNRIGDLYKMVFENSFKEDLQEVGFPHLYDHIKNVQEKRNDFIHNNPKAIDEQMINDTVKYLQDVQQAWILIYNKRSTKNKSTT